MNELVEFGRWVVSDGAPAEPLTWMVLRECDNGMRLLVTRNIIEQKLYVEENRATTWAECDLRRWLGTEFPKAAFTDEERESLVQARLSTPDNPESGTFGGADTVDPVFLLSRDEAAALFPDDRSRSAAATPHAVAQGCCSNWWWLRSPGEFQTGPDVVLGDGRIFNCNGHYNRNLIGVRPAILLRCDDERFLA